MDVTSYDDGRSCPGGCDSHVVFRSVHNGTANAFRPGPGDDPFSARTAPEQCVRGEPCVICFGPEDSSCLVTTYRGSGPPEGRFDVTPAFLEEWCPRSDIPTTLAAKCRSHMQAAERLAQKINCIADPEHPRCVAVMNAAIATKAADAPRFAECMRMGEAAYNAAQNDPALRRTHGCAYFLNRTHPNGGWRLLTPAACRDGYLVGRDGLDCCSANPVQAAIDPVECSPYYQ